VSRLKTPTLRQLRRYAIARSLFRVSSLPRAIARLGFVQADPMRAPARAQDELDYTFRYPTLDSALDDVFAKTP